MALTVAKGLMGIGLLLFLAGLVLWGLQKAGFSLPLGRLPGDIYLSKGNWSLSFPIVSCILASIVLSLLVNALSRWFLK